LSVQCNTCQATTAVDLKLVVPAPSKDTVSVVPKSDFVIITWTAAETQAMALVFGKDLYRFDAENDNNFTPLFSAISLHPPRRSTTLISSGPR
jgi:hypothetical protein